MGFDLSPLLLALLSSSPLHSSSHIIPPISSLLIAFPLLSYHLLTSPLSPISSLLSSRAVLPAAGELPGGRGSVPGPTAAAVLRPVRQQGDDQLLLLVGRRLRKRRTDGSLPVLPEQVLQQEEQEGGEGERQRG